MYNINTSYAAPPKKDRRQIILEAGGSTVFLLAALAFTAETLIKLTQIMNGIGFSAFGFRSTFDSLIAIALLIIAPTILTCVGMWMFFAMTRSGGVQMGGLNVLMGAVIAQYTLEFFVCGYSVVYLLRRSDYSSRLPDLFNLEEQIGWSSSVASIMLISFIVTIAAIGLYVFGILKTIIVARRTLQTGRWSGTIPVILIVLNYFFASSAITGIFTGLNGGNPAEAVQELCRAASLILINVKLHHLRNRI